MEKLKHLEKLEKKYDKKLIIAAKIMDFDQIKKINNYITIVDNIKSNFGKKVEVTLRGTPEDPVYDDYVYLSAKEVGRKDIMKLFEDRKISSEEEYQRINNEIYQELWNYRCESFDKDNNGIYDSDDIEKLKMEIKDLDLHGKQVKDLIENFSYMYTRIYSYAKKNNLWLFKLFNVLGLVVDRVDKLDSIGKLDMFMKIFNYEGNDWKDISSTHKRLIKRVIDENKLNFSVFLIRYNVTYTDNRVYQSINEIKNDLAEKGLSNASIQQICSFDGGRTICNIESFANKNGLKMNEIWFALGILYGEKTLLTETGTKQDFVYHNDDEMIKDITSKGLIGKDKRAVLNYDGGKTFGRISKYAKYCGVDVQSIWDKLNVKKSEKLNIEMEFSTIDQLKKLVEQLGLKGKTINEIVRTEINLNSQIKKYARTSELSMPEIWKYIGIKRGQGFESLDQILEEIKQRGYKTAKEIRISDLKFYKKICGFVERNNDITTKDIREKAGISVSNDGRPSKKDK